jgi:hypothetical protein
VSRQGVPKTAWTRAPVPAVPAVESPAKETLGQIRTKNPPTFKSSKSQETWEERFDKEEMQVEQKEAEAILAARKDQLKAIEDELTVRRINRRIALGFGAAGMTMLGTLNKVANEIGDRITLNGDKMSSKELRDTVQVLSSAISRSQSAIEAAAKTERWMLRHPLSEADRDDTELDNMTEESAKLLLENLAKQLGHIQKSQRPVIELAASEGETIQ